MAVVEVPRYGDRHRSNFLLAIVALGCGLRLYPLLLPHNLTGVMEYDDGVYYAAARMLVHGVVPYQQFALVHPPLSTILLSPFAVVGSLFGDPVGMATARLAVIGIAALNIVFVYRLGRVIAPARPPVAYVAAFAYAVCPNAVVAEHTVLLEPILNAFALPALILLLRPRPRVWAAGALLGLACCVKVFAIVYVVVLVGWLLHHRWFGLVRQFVAGVGISAAVVLAPFLALAPAAFWRDVVLSQLSRPADGVGPVLARLTDMTGFAVLPEFIAIALSVAILCGLVVTARRGGLLLVPTIATAIAAAFALGPAYFRHYGAVVSPGLAIAIGLVMARPSLKIVWCHVATAALAVMVIGSVLLDAGWMGQPDLAAQAARLPPDACIYYQSVSLALAANRYRIPSASCPGWVDGRGDAIADRATTRSFSGLFLRDADWQGETLTQLRYAQALLLRSDPQQVTEWSAPLRRYVLAHFRLAWNDRDTRVHAQLWMRMAGQLTTLRAIDDVGRHQQLRALGGDS